MTTVIQTNAHVATGPRAATHAALGVMLTDAAIEPRTAARLVRPGAAARLAGSLARRPDRAWRESWLFHRLMQGYLALDAVVDGLVDDAELDWRGGRTDAFHAGEPARRDRADELPCDQPAGAQGDDRSRSPPPSCRPDRRHRLARRTPPRAEQARRSRGRERPGRSMARCGLTSAHANAGGQDVATPPSESTIGRCGAGACMRLLPAGPAPSRKSSCTRAPRAWQGRPRPGSPRRRRSFRLRGAQQSRVD